MITKFNKWYDGIQEPYRFLFFFFCLALPPIIGINSDNKIIAGISVAFILFFIFSRLMFLDRSKKDESN